MDIRNASAARWPSHHRDFGLNCHHPRKAGDDSIPETPAMESRSRGVPDTPLEPVIGLAEGETRWRSMTTACEAVRARRALNRLSTPG